MKLIKVEAQGFKSFADRITLEFDGGVVGIVGPNGSGKSNINDAIKWVLGEQSSKALRGDSMEDVIFAGSKTVKELDKAEVILTFDNSDGALKIPHKTFTISRVLKRGKGANEYYVNGELARSKDIKEIAMESGISKSSLAIISQGTISDIAEASPEDRRGIIEEAAGTSKYKARKVDTLRKLDQTSESLDKVKIKIAEMERQLKTLQKQAEKAKVFLEKSNALKSIEVALIVEDLTFFGNELERLAKELDGVDETKQDFELKIQKFESTIKENSSYKSNLELEADKISQELENINNKLAQIKLQEAKKEERRKMIISGELKATSQEKLENIKSELESLNKKISLIKIVEEKNKKEIEEIKQETSNIEQEISLKKVEINQSINKQQQTKIKLEMLKDQKNSKTNLFKGTKNVVENSFLFKGFKGTVADLIKIESEFVPAIEAILNNALQHIVVDVSDTAVKAIEFLKKNNGGRATFIPLNSIQEKNVREDHQLLLRKQKGFVAIASELVSVSDEFEKLRNFLLGNIIVAQTINDANKISELMNFKYMVVSLDGDIIRVGGIMSGGTKKESTNMLGIDEKIKELENIIPIINERVQTLDEEIKKLENRKKEISIISSKYQSDNIQTGYKKNQYEEQFSSLKLDYETLSKNNLDLEKYENFHDNSQELELAKNDLQVSLISKRELISKLGAEISNLTSKKQDLDQELRILNNQFIKKETERNKANYYVNNSKKRLSEHYQMTFEMASENYKLEIPVDEARTFVETLKQEIKELGNVNIDSIEECEAAEERYKEFSQHRDELEDAKNKILEAISELDKIIISRIEETVKVVNEEFGKVFRAMFGGGDAQVQYTDPSNILETGIDIMAQPPGKSVKNLKLFSGGEKAIIAISLLFAIIKAKPIPLCILDEVEAALDESNVIRYAEFLQTLKDKTQFLVITHRHGTMSRVDHLFGATMQKRGVTSFFTVELSKAKELVQETSNN